MAINDCNYLDSDSDNSLFCDLLVFFLYDSFGVVLSSPRDGISADIWNGKTEDQSLDPSGIRDQAGGLTASGSRSPFAGSVGICCVYWSTPLAGPENSICDVSSVGADSHGYGEIYRTAIFKEKHYRADYLRAGVSEISWMFKCKNVLTFSNI